MDAASRLQQAIARLTALLRERMELGELASAVARDACDLVGAESCSVMLLDTARQQLSCYAAHGLTPEEVREIRFRVGEGIAGVAVADRRALRIDDVTLDNRFVLKTQHLRIRSCLSVPVIVRGEAIGALTVTHSSPAHFGDSESAVLELWAQAVGMDLESALLYRLSLTDALTHAYNRRYLEEVVPRQFAWAAPLADGRRPMAALFIDLDGFKQVNDRYGHDAGDAVLVETAARLLGCVRGEDVVLRYGGDEFLVLLTGSSAALAEPIAGRIDEELRARPVMVGEQAIAVSGSVGVASDGTAKTFDELLKQVDRAMYAAKQARR
jgi:two-component system, cell cycle response regulator